MSGCAATVVAQRFQMRCDCVVNGDHTCRYRGEVGYRAEIRNGAGRRWRTPSPWSPSTSPKRQRRR